MKAIIPIAGADLLIHTAQYLPSRPLVPVAHKPIIAHIIDHLLQAGIHEQIFVVNSFKEHIKAFINNQYADKISATFIEQTPRRGLAHALWVCRKEIINEEEILVTLGDTIFLNAPRNILNIPGSVLGVREVDNPQDFGIASINSLGHALSVSEKPQIPRSNLALVGLYKFDNISILIQTLDSIIHQPPKNGKAYTLTDAIEAMIQQGITFHTLTVEEWYDCGNKAGILHANQTLLSRIPLQHNPELKDSIIIPPVFISPGSDIRQCIIGPNVSIGPHTHLDTSIVRNSVISTRASVSTVQLQHSIIGYATTLKGKLWGMQTGDYGEIEFEQ